jgi:two-component system, cell cycle sensor histidine kinase and response regulator CckA
MQKLRFACADRCARSLPLSAKLPPIVQTEDLSGNLPRNELSRAAAILAAIPDAVVVTDLDGMVTYWNYGAAALFGWTADEMVGAPLLARVPEEMQPRFTKDRERVLAGEPIHGEYEDVRKDGSRILTDTRVSLIRDEADQPAAVLRISRDVTEQRMLGRVLEAMPEAVICLDADNRIVSCNAAAERTFGYSAEELLGQPVNLLAPAAEHQLPCQIPSIIAATHRDGGWTGEVVRRRKDGSHFPARLTTGVVRDSEGRIIGQAGLIQDISEQRLREAQMRRAERIASLGTMLGGLAHELNNPLTSIKSFAQLLLLDERPAEDREGLEVIHQESGRAARLVADLRQLARQTQEAAGPAPEAVELNELVRQVLESMSARRDPYPGDLEVDLAPEPLRMWGDRVRLEQLIQQLVLNAEQAVRSRAPSRWIRVRTRSGASGITLGVDDSGVGIRPDHLDRIFDPFWTTRKPGEGMGLGLSLVHSVVTEHEGTIRVESEPGRGSAFVVEFPWNSDPARRSGLTPRASVSLRILLVEDEAPIRITLARFLELRGHRVRAVEHGREALRRIREGEEFEVIVSDMRMPGLAGDDLYRILAGRGDGTEQKMIFVTGDPCCADGDDGDDGVGVRGVPVILKPFDLVEVAERIEWLAAHR